mgnify:CR=1 FL=1
MSIRPALKLSRGSLAASRLNQPTNVQGQVVHMKTFDCQFVSRRLVFLALLVTFRGECLGEYPLKPVPFNEVELTSDFWRPRLETQLKTAAIAYYRATGKKKLLDVAEKSARHINRVIFEGAPDYNEGRPILQAPGHQELELALVKLYRVTGNQLYLDMARRFLEIRGVPYVPEGEGVMAPTYAQQHAPVTDQKEAVGHAVRATYLYSAMADVGTLTGQSAYGKALDRIWENITNTRMHITGGLGAVHGIVGFGAQYELPNDGEICVTVDPPTPTRFRLLLRIPTWARQQFVPGALYRFVDMNTEAVRLAINGEDASLKLDKGFVSIEREWRSGDRVVLNLPMPVRVSECHPAVKANTNRVALTRGPFVLCAEGVDNGGATQRFFFDELPETSHAIIKTTAIESGSFIQAEVPAQAVTESGKPADKRLILTPYYAWNNRGITSMTVWFPRDQSLAVFDPHALPQESVFKEITASHTAEEDTVNAIGDGHVDKWSSGKKVLRWTSRGQAGKSQWVIGRLHDTKSIRSVGVFWMNRSQGDVKFPQEWSLEVEQNGKWRPFELYTTDKYDTRANQFNVVHPAAPTECDAIRIKMTPRNETAVGIIEVQVVFED